MLKYALRHVIAAAFFALFGAVYEHFSHGVYSAYMIYAFAIPLVFGALPCGLLVILQKKIPLLSLRLWSYAVAALTAGCVWKGVLDIYGTTNRLLIIYPVAAAVLAFISIILLLTRKKWFYSA